MHILLANFTKMVQDSGGLAKVTSAFANEMNRRGHRVTLVYSDEKNGEFYFPTDTAVTLYDLRDNHGQRIVFPMGMKIKREIYRLFSKRKAQTVNNDFAEEYLIEPLRTIITETQPDVIVSFQPAASKLLVMDLQVTIPVITMSHGDPEDYFHTYPFAEIPAIEKSTINQVLLPSFKSCIERHLPKAKVTVIGNAIPQYEKVVDLSVQKDMYRIGFLARLAKNHKQPHLLVEAFCRLAKAYPKWELVLWGSPQGKVFFKQLQKMVKQAGLESRITFAGPTNDVEGALSTCDIFAFPSAYEGFGLSLGEAMSKGIPAVGFASCSAVNELIIDGYNGILCKEGAEGLEEGLRTLMDSQALRVEYGKHAKESMKQYDPQLIWGTWETLMQDVVAYSR